MYVNLCARIQLFISFFSKKKCNSKSKKIFICVHKSVFLVKIHKKYKFSNFCVEVIKNIVYKSLIWEKNVLLYFV
jgi:hypothetical protein